MRAYPSLAPGNILAGHFSLAYCHVPVYSVEILLGRVLLEEFRGQPERCLFLDFYFYLIAGISTVAFVWSSVLCLIAQRLACSFQLLLLYVPCFLCLQIFFSMDQYLVVDGTAFVFPITCKYIFLVQGCLALLSTHRKYGYVSPITKSVLCNRTDHVTYVTALTHLWSLRLPESNS